MQSEIVVNLYGESLCFSHVRFRDEESNCCGCEISICCSISKKVWETLRNIVFLILMHLALKYTIVSSASIARTTEAICSNLLCRHHMQMQSTPLRNCSTLSDPLQLGEGGSGKALKLCSWNVTKYGQWDTLPHTCQPGPNLHWPLPNFLPDQY